MKKKAVIKLLALTLCILFSISLICFYWPKPIITDVDETEIGLVLLYVGDGKEIEIKDYSEKEILSYLSMCKEQRSIFAEELHYMDDMEIRIILNGKDAKVVTLGNVNYSDTGGIKCNVLNAEEVKVKMKEMINYLSYFAEVKSGSSIRTQRDSSILDRLSYGRPVQ